MKLKTIVPDIIFILLVTVVLVIMSQTDHMNALVKFPFLFLYGAYVTGRIAGELSHRSRQPK